jgi:hypothetical protein
MIDFEQLSKIKCLCLIKRSIKIIVCCFLIGCFINNDRIICNHVFYAMILGGRPDKMSRAIQFRAGSI